MLENGFEPYLCRIFQYLQSGIVSNSKVFLMIISIYFGFVSRCKGIYTREQDYLIGAFRFDICVQTKLTKWVNPFMNASNCTENVAMPRIFVYCGKTIIHAHKSEMPKKGSTHGISICPVFVVVVCLINDKVIENTFFCHISNGFDWKFRNCLPYLPSSLSLCVCLPICLYIYFSSISLYINIHTKYT